MPVKKENKILKIFLTIVLVAVSVFAILVAIKSYKYLVEKNSTTDTSDIKNNDITNPYDSNNQKSESSAKTVEINEKDLPKDALLKVPFTTQAPFANWDMPYQEACEEASLIMVYHYIQNTDIESKETADKELLALINFETENDYKADVTLKELAEIADKYYGLKQARIVENMTSKKIKKEISEGKPVILPAAGKLLENPNFRAGGPVYHMLVIKGYDEKGFITNDPGTRLGNNFRYSFENLEQSVHDWNPENILNGQRNFLVFDK